LLGLAAGGALGALALGGKGSSATPAAAAVAYPIPTVTPSVGKPIIIITSP
jgi:hypothetical protein